MSENALNALAGGGAASQIDWEKRYRELEKSMNGVRVEEGRVRKLDEELKARDKRIAELEAEARKRSIASDVPEEMRAAVPDEVADFTEKMVNSVASRYEQKIREFEERNAADKAKREADDRNALVEKINSTFPGFMASVTNGGDKEKEWESYQVYNSASINEAIRNNDFNTLSYHIRQFYSTHLGVQVPSAGQDGSAAPDPRTHGGGSAGTQAQNGKVYTSEEFVGLYDKIEELRAKGDYAEMRRLEAEIKNAPAEGRVKDS